MCDGCQIDIVELAQLDELGLAGEQFELLFRPELQSPLDLDVLLRGNGKEYDVAVELIHDSLKSHACAQHRGDLRVVPACVRRVRLRVSERMIRDDQRIQLAEDGQR